MFEYLRNLSDRVKFGYFQLFNIRTNFKTIQKCKKEISFSFKESCSNIAFNKQ